MKHFPLLVLFLVAVVGHVAVQVIRPFLIAFRFLNFSFYFIGKWCRRKKEPK